MRLTCIFSKRRIKWLLITAVTSVMFFIMHVTMTNSTQYVSNMDIARLHAQEAIVLPWMVDRQQERQEEQQKSSHNVLTAAIRRDVIVKPIDDVIVKQEHEADPSVVKLLVSAYYRSGSTLVAEIPAIANDSFYLFEPYHDLFASWYGAQGYHETTFLPGGAKRTLPPDEQTKMVDALIDMFECRFDRLPIQFYSNVFFWVVNHPTNNNYYQCAAKAKVLFRHWQSCLQPLAEVCPQTVYTNSERALLCHSAMTASGTQEGAKLGFLSPFVAYRQCMANYTKQMSHCHGILQQTCRNAKQRVIKTLRLDMETIGLAMRRYPNLRVLHLVRDPGAMVNSRLAVNVSEGFNTTVCKRLLADVEERQRLEGMEGYRGRFLELQYEDTVKSFNTTAHKIYKFSRISVPGNLKKWLNEHVKGQKDNDVLGTIRKNPTEHVDKWLKGKFRHEIVHLLTHNPDCRRVRELLGYEFI